VARRLPFAGGVEEATLHNFITKYLGSLYAQRIFLSVGLYCQSSRRIY
jgi:hypothetical protein